MEMQVMMNEIRTRRGPDPEWSAHVAQAERLYEGGDRFGLTTLYQMMCGSGGHRPWTPANVSRLAEQRAAISPAPPSSL